MMNFSRNLRLEYNDKTYYFDSIEKAIKELKKLTGNNYNHDFILEMINSNHINVNDWLNYYDNNISKLPDENLKDRIYKSKSNYNKKLLCLYKSAKHLLKQNDIYGKEFQFYDINKIEKITEDDYAGICLLVSMYNAFPKIFNYSPKNLVGFLKEFKKDEYDKTNNIVDKLNKIFNLDIDVFKIYHSVLSGDIENQLEELINSGIPVVMECYDESLNAGHDVTVIGFDRDWFYIIENEKDQLKNDMIKAYSSKYETNFEIIKNIIKDYYNGIIKVNRNFLIKSFNYIDLIYFNPKLKYDRFNNKIVYFSDLTIRLNRLMTYDERKNVKKH